MTTTFTLLNNVSVDTNGPGILADGAKKTLSIWATSFGGGTVTIQGSPDGGTTWITLTVDGSPATFTANAIMTIDFMATGMETRATLTGSSGASGVNATIR